MIIEPVAFTRHISNWSVQQAPYSVSSAGKAVPETNRPIGLRSNTIFRGIDFAKRAYFHSHSLDFLILFVKNSIT